MALDKQIQIYCFDTADFYSNEEKNLHMQNHRLKSERNQLVNGYTFKGSSGRVKRTVMGLGDIEKKLREYGVSDDDLKSVARNEFDFSGYGEDAEMMTELGHRYSKQKDIVRMKNKKAKEAKDNLLLLLANKVEANIRSNGTHHIRELRDEAVADKNIISVFDSYFTRTIGAEQDELCKDFMVIQVYYFDVIKDLIYHGFMFEGEKYVYFTSSAGQIRTKKCVFVRESVWKKYERSLMCGLTIDKINAKGGNNPNKHLAYMALANSATDVWEEFDIDKTIVIDDFETDVLGTYDLVDETDYSIKRQNKHVPITHTDGAGMMLPCMGKNRMVRLPWVKGLLGVFDFIKFIEEHGCSPVLKDIYGKEHDLIAEDIQVVFCKSQFKMHKYYDSWDEYKESYKKYNCSAGYTNLEEDRIKDATINYQMLQSLTDITDDEIAEISGQSVGKLKNLCSSVKNIKDAFGVTPYNTNKTAFQESIDLYPDLLNDEYAKSHLRSIKDSIIKKCKSGKLNVRGKYTFLLPDFYAACEYWFLGEENPNGLLDDGEVFCWLFRKDDKLDCLRSPHLFMEHAIRKNIACREYEERQKKLREWFVTDAVYTSCKDLISKILQFDVDGDKSLVVADKTLIEVAERNLEKFDIVPLYYNMKKAEPRPLNNAAIYDGLHAAFVGGNIGIYSNNISKIWNSEVFVNGTHEEQCDAIDVIRLLCMENNFVIDFAKTLYKPTRPDEIDEKINEFTKDPLPHFFKYAKDKRDSQVLGSNESFVNKLEAIIPNPRINCRKLGLDEIDYTLMMKNPDIEFDVAFTDKGKIIKEETDPVIVKYCEFNKEYYLALDSMLCSDKDNSSDSYLRTVAKHRKIFSDVRYALSLYGYNNYDVVDILVKFLYGIKKSNNKTALWLCYGDIILENLESHLRPQTKDIQCVDCGLWFEVGIYDSKTCRCPGCHDEYRREYKRIKERERRNRLRGQTHTI